MVRKQSVLSATIALLLAFAGTAAAAVSSTGDVSSRQGDRFRPTIPENETFTGRLVNSLPAEQAGDAGWHLQRPGRLIPLNVSEVSARRVARFQGQRVRIDGYWMQPLGGDRVFVVTRIRPA